MIINEILKEKFDYLVKNKIIKGKVADIRSYESEDQLSWFLEKFDDQIMTAKMEERLNSWQEQYPNKKIIFVGFGNWISLENDLWPWRMELWHRDVENRIADIVFNQKKLQGKVYLNIISTRLEKKYQGRAYGNLLYETLLDLSQDGLIIDTTKRSNVGMASDIWKKFGGKKFGEYIIIPKSINESVKTAIKRFGHIYGEDLIRRMANALDPTPIKKYIEWVCKQYLNDIPNIKYFEKQGDLQNFFNSDLKLFSKFEDLIKRNIVTGKEADINSYKNHQELFQFLSEKEMVITRSQIKREFSKVKNKTIENGNMIILISNEEEAKKYGKGTKWCISAEEDNQFNTYRYGSRIYTIYFIITKNNEKYAVLIPQKLDDDFSICDAQDDKIEYDVNLSQSKVLKRLGISWRNFKYVPLSYDELISIPGALARAILRLKRMPKGERKNEMFEKVILNYKVKNMIPMLICRYVEATEERWPEIEEMIFDSGYCFKYAENLKMRLSDEIENKWLHHDWKNENNFSWFLDNIPYYCVRGRKQRWPEMEKVFPIFWSEAYCHFFDIDNDEQEKLNLKYDEIFKQK